MQVVIESVTHVLPKECARPFGNSASHYLGKPPPSIPRHLHNSNWGRIPFLPLPTASPTFVFFLLPQPLHFSLYSPPVPGCCSPNQHRIVFGLVGGSVPELADDNSKTLPKAQRTQGLSAFTYVTISSHITNWSKLSFRILTKLQLQNLDKILASKSSASKS